MNQWRKFILSEVIKTTVKDLTFDMLKDAFPDKYQKIRSSRIQPNGEMGPVYETNDSISIRYGGASITIIDEKAFQQWKKYTKDYADSEVILNPNPDVHSDHVYVPDIEEYIKNKYKGIGDYYSKKGPGGFTGD